MRIGFWPRPANAPIRRFSMASMMRLTGWGSRPFPFAFLFRGHLHPKLQADLDVAQFQKDVLARSCRSELEVQRLVERIAHDRGHHRDQGPRPVPVVKEAMSREDEDDEDNKWVDSHATDRFSSATDDVSLQPTVEQCQDFAFPLPALLSLPFQSQDRSGIG